MDKSNYRILLADENPTSRRDFTFLLKLSGHEVHTMNSSMEALNWVNILPDEEMRPHLILIVNFSCLGGPEYYEHLKSYPYEIPIMIVDRDPQSGKQIVWFKESGQSPRITLSPQPSLIVQIVNRYLRKRIAV